MARPVTYEQMERRGYVLYGCWPMCSPECETATHYLAVFAASSVLSRGDLFGTLAQFGVYSYQWLTYY